MSESEFTELAEFRRLKGFGMRVEFGILDWSEF